MEGGTMAAGDAENRRIRARHPTDRLSELPDSLLLHILSFLHMRDAVSAARISRRWRHLWTATPCLDFCSYGAELTPNFIDTALMLHDRVKVRAFRAAVCTGPYQNVSDDRDQFIMRVYNWVRFALRRGVEELHLDCYDRDYAYFFFLQESPLPDSLYTCESLVSLWMRFGIMEPPSRISMTSLKYLTLSRSEIDPVVLGNVLAGCPILESLTLEECNTSREECNTSGGLKVHAERANLKTLKISDVIYGQYLDSVYDLLISAPSITTLAIQGYMRMPYHMNDLSSLVTASVDLRYMLHWEVERGNYECLRDLLRDLSHVRVLRLCSWCVQVLSVKAPESSWSSLDFNVMSLELVVGFIPREFPGIFLTLRSFTKLEYLAIDVCENRRIRFLGDIAEEYVDETTYVMPTERSSPNMLQHLKTVSITGLRGTLGAEAENETVQQIHEKCHNVFKFIQFLLENSPVLERLTISCSENASKLTNKTFEVLFTLSSSLFALPRASPNALVIIQDK